MSPRWGFFDKNCAGAASVKMRQLKYFIALKAQNLISLGWSAQRVTLGSRSPIFESCKDDTYSRSNLCRPFRTQISRIPDSRVPLRSLLRLPATTVSHSNAARWGFSFKSALHAAKVGIFRIDYLGFPRSRNLAANLSPSGI